MQVQIWRSFSCNNSSDYRLVARFKDAKAAEAMGAELKKFFSAYAKKMDEHLEEHDYDFPDEPIPFFVEFAKKHGVKAKDDPLTWGDEGLQGDEPEVAVAGSTLAIYHTYCGGFGEDLPAILKKAGAKVEDEESRSAPELVCSFSLPAGKAGEKLAAELSRFLEQGKKHDQICDFELPPPWDKRQKLTYEEGSTVSWASDGKTFAFAMPFAIQGFDALKAYLAKHKCAEVSIAFGDEAAKKAIEKLAKAAQPKNAVTAAPAAAAIDPKGKKFLFTGKLATMSRDEAKARVAKIGGTTASSVSKDLDYLVVGDDGSALYGAGAKGDKMLAAEKLIAKGATLQIISENAFLSIGAGPAAAAKVSAPAAAKAVKPVKATAAAKKKAR